MVKTIKYMPTGIDEALFHGMDIDLNNHINIVEAFRERYKLIVEASWLPNAKKFVPCVRSMGYTPRTIDKYVLRNNLNNNQEALTNYKFDNYVDALDVAIHVAKVYLVSFIIYNSREKVCGSNGINKLASLVDVFPNYNVHKAHIINEVFSVIREDGYSVFQKLDEIINP